MEFNAQILIDKTAEIFEGLNSAIRGDLDNKGISNTGAAKNSIRVEVDGMAVRSLGVDYLEFLNRGRGPGKYPPHSNLVEWVRSKLGITENAESVAFFVGWKIANDGTSIFNNNSKGIKNNSKGIKNYSKGIELDKKVEDVKAQINEIIPAIVKQELTIGLTKYMKDFQSKANQNNNLKM